MSTEQTTTPDQVAVYPTRDEVFYDRGVWPMGEEGDMGLLAEGHGRRALAAISAHERRMRGYSGWARVDSPPDAREVWVVIHETCGCTPEQHAAHVANDDPSLDGWVECDCKRYGLPPCRDEFGWTADNVDAGTPGALAMTEVSW